MRNRIRPGPLPFHALLAAGGAAVLTGTMVTVGAYTTGGSTPGDTPYRELAGPGHGRGMSQHGAFDNAQQGWLAERILEHYYPGATLGTVPPTVLAVRLQGMDNGSLDAFADAGIRVAGRELEPGQVAHLTPLPDGGANVVVTVGCDGEVLWQSATSDPWVYPLDPNPGRPAAEHLKLCGGPSYRGALGVASENGESRVVNRVDVEDYLLGVVPAEMQANWADKGAAEALRAQAIAARSYALSETRYPYAGTCDSTDCQVYPGTAKEDPRAAAAVASTAGTVLLRDGRILRSEYSSAPDGGEPADIQTFEVGPMPSELEVARPPADPRTRTSTTETIIDAEYRRTGGEDGPLGAPLGPEWVLPLNSGTYRLFTNGVIIATPTLGPQVIDFDTLLDLIPDPDERPSIPENMPESGAVPPGSDTSPGQNAVPGSESTTGPDVAPGAESVPLGPEHVVPGEPSEPVSSE
ncbi:SpoIID/LytB domain-containing protein [Nocardia puris]|uniref:SpoIID/LytB domain protein n=2 Tax=Nocardia puris TaxID=208602 RepID=A0A366DNZ8_9NOCA|nr:SpoIID/LytB domain-containing protein [Nocardia puris]MBF6214252.1 SpoIID/LytB domain-containing protein [Nocardia puris]MBF6365258.1 SpoIID/LytB domain-containing protein [Nocardia puris]MBF6459660.1 SpoIID/LytB domain-containing protein [Nocardia puris]RBO91796.1 SpoIID/LytB domain protein [Nocardia puris]